MAISIFHRCDVRAENSVSSSQGPEVIKIVMLNSAEHENFPAHKC